MFSLFLWPWRTVISWLWSFHQRPVEYDNDEIQRVLFPQTVQEDTEETTEKSDTDQPICQRRVGRITSLQTDYGLIDGKYYFDIWRLSNIHAKVGQTVQYYAYRTDTNSEWKVTKVTVEEWEGGFSSENPSTVLRECAVIQRILPVKVEDRRGKIYKLSSNLEFNLDKISADFIPIKGDWIELAVLTEISDDKEESLKDNIIEIQSIKARNNRMYHGEITHLRDGLGIINSEVYFRDDVCEPGYSPSIGDMVIAKVIESEQGALVSRAILVFPMASEETGNTLLAHIEQENLFCCKNGISVSEECSKKNLLIGDQTTYNVKVENFSNDTHIITRVTLKNSASSKVMTIPDTVLYPYTLASGQCLEFEVIAVARSPGFFSDILILHFEGDWQVCYLLDFFVDVDHQSRMPPDADRMPLKQGNVIYERRKNAVSELCATKNGFIIPGRKTIKAPPFLPTRLEHYPIPKLMEEIFMNDTNQKNADLEAELIKTYPFLVEELHRDNYLNKFHMLLHLEDIETLVAIKKYDQERVSFHVNGDYLVMEIANLAESRPSLAVGDKLIATDPAIFQENSARYEGYIHKVGSDRIYLKFNESFQHSYGGKDYSVTFSHNRAPIRRCHQALNEVIKNLRFAWLFPAGLGTLKPIQINVVGEFPSSFAERVHECAVAPTKKPTFPTLKSHKTRVLNKDEFWQTEDDEVKEETSEGSGDGPKQPTSGHEYSSISISANISEIKWQSRTTGKNEAENTNANEATPPKLPQSVPKKAAVRQEKVVRWVNQDLNHFQREAVRNILKGEARPLPYIIFGPPGTGKTITVVETILQIAFLMEDSRILVATPSNSSADLICERLIGWNLSSIVPGNLTRLVGYNYMIDNRMSPVVKSYACVIDLDLSRDEKIRSDADGVRFASRENIGRSKITIGTCTSLGSLYNLGFPKNHFTHVVIDEAGQSMEPEVLIPLAFMNDQTQAILAGDPRQLGPVVISTIAKLFGLGESLLSRFLYRFPYHRDPESYPDTDGYDPRLVTRLLYNYRSLPEILNYYSTLFYDSKLTAQVCGVCSPEADILKQLKQLRENTINEITGVIFCGVRGVNKQDDDSPSWYNEHEMLQVSSCMAALYRDGMTANDIGIITPYQKQVMKIREQLRCLDLDVPKVGTVEEFQGQERNVIIISTVRSDEGLIERDRKFALGFVSSQQRLNVAISRARAVLIIIGNPHLLVKDLSWKKLLKMCIENNCYCGADLPSTLWR